jgi:hypothetical protein
VLHVKLSIGMFSLWSHFLTCLMVVCVVYREGSNSKSGGWVDLYCRHASW